MKKHKWWNDDDPLGVDFQRYWLCHDMRNHRSLDEYREWAYNEFNVRSDEELPPEAKTFLFSWAELFPNGV